ncbi:recombinase zinc beta ribbon domain-containing protein [Alkalihalobacillus deserti]|uniref:recombinase zinc beta ribbon domain-containing protein n=1 Tax=Alkalihalobacillus deserti TaxID=2879466 RepID=UPI00223E6CB1|nr:recombinase zinc beta ribbon domain-containing protein [Alkalihalobacillus deserti]
MKIRTKFITAPKKHLFTNILFCSDCGKGMWYRSNRKGYICGNYARHGKKACSSHSIKEDLLKDTILTDIKMLVNEIFQEEYVKQLEAQTKKSKQNLQKQLDKIEKQVNLIKGQKRKYINMLAEEIITQKEYREIVDANNIEIKELVKKKTDLLTAMESEQTVDNIDLLKQEHLKFLNINELTPKGLHRLINRIEVKADGTPIIHYRFSAPKIK